VLLGTLQLSAHGDNLEFVPLETTKVIAVPILNDDVPEPEEKRFWVQLKSPTGAEPLVTEVTDAAVVIRDDDRGFKEFHGEIGCCLGRADRDKIAVQPDGKILLITTTPRFRGHSLRRVAGPGCGRDETGRMASASLERRNTHTGTQPALEPLAARRHSLRCRSHFLTQSGLGLQNGDEVAQSNVSFVFRALLRSQLPFVAPVGEHINPRLQRLIRTEIQQLLFSVTTNTAAQRLEESIRQRRLACSSIHCGFVTPANLKRKQRLFDYCTG
jgi:hypothetical protein